MEQTNESTGKEIERLEWASFVTANSNVENILI